MPFQTPITIEALLRRIQHGELVLPAVQREFVWQAEQICRLFDSLLQGYPIGSFLFWKVLPEHVGDYAFYNFLTDYHQLKSSHLPRAHVDAKVGATAILDGQQRLTALNIGLRGSFAERLPGKWVRNPESYPTKHLYLDLCAPAPENELGMEYDFQFLTANEATSRNLPSIEHHWFPVREILKLEEGAGIFNYTLDSGLNAQKRPFSVLSRLYSTVHSHLIINYFEEESQDLDKVLNIFIRVNSGGTVLSYSDLLLSVATAQWKDIDAKAAVYDLVDDLNDSGQGFAFSKDLVLKSGLVLADITNIRFSVTNFNAANMSALERDWSKIATALRLAVHLLAGFGYSAKTLSADSVVIPIAYYLYHVKGSDSFLTAQKHATDREAIRLWTVRSLLKRGIWGSGLDTLLGHLRATIKERGSDGFPVGELESVMAQRGKSIRFTGEELDALLDTSYGDKRAMLVLSLLYPGMDFRNEFHVDHIFPRSHFTRKRLTESGVPESAIERYMGEVNALPNLQLLEGPINVEKQATMPGDWVGVQYADSNARNAYMARHDLMDMPDSLAAFETFFSARRGRIHARLRKLLDLAPED